MDLDQALEVLGVDADTLDPDVLGALRDADRRRRGVTDLSNALSDRYQAGPTPAGGAFRDMVNAELRAQGLGRPDNQEDDEHGQP